jgi:hypothetical protein
MTLFSLLFVKGNLNGGFDAPDPNPVQFTVSQHFASNQFQIDALPGFQTGSRFSQESRTNNASASGKCPSLFKMAILTILSLTLLFSIGTFRLSSDLNQWNRIVLSIRFSTQIPIL